ncbi:MAG: hypothetical protein M1835_007571 [Candelina submexicana]|nr:MAG: hypothetical protein M1835_007571 [Candelina submexicana]
MNGNREMAEGDTEVMAGQTQLRAPVDGHRSKRIKTESHLDNSTNPQAPLAEQFSASNGLQTADKPPLPPLSNGDEAAGHPHSLSEIEALAHQAAASAMEGFNQHIHPGNAEYSDDSTFEVHDATNRQPLLEGRREQSIAPEIDFSSAPSDPTELAIWVARQVSLFGEGRYSVGSEDEDGRPRMHMHPPAAFNRRNDEDDDPIRVAERERIREENRERKKRWRQSNTERSTQPCISSSIETKCSALLTSCNQTDKDNDLRCRINKRAKKLYGLDQSSEKSAWMESEFNKRRTKRETKERIRSFDSTDFPGFQLNPGFGNALFPAPGVGPQGDTNAAGLLLANALLGVGNNSAGPNAEAANALIAALEGGVVDPKPFTEALRTMAMNPDIMEGINAVIGYPSYDDDDGDIGSGDENGDLPMQTTEQLQNGEVEASRPVETDGDSSDIIRALNAATAMLNGLNGSAPEGLTQASGDGQLNGFTAINGATDRKDSGSSESLNSNDHGLNPSQIDALLALANGGSLTGDGDQGTLLDVDEPASPRHEHTPQPDNDVTATLQRIIQHLQDNGNSSLGRESRQADPNNNLGQPRDASSPNALYSVLQHSSSYVPMNTVIPAAQGHATSQFFAKLSHHSRGSTPIGGGINPAHASSYGSTAQMNEKIIARANSKGRSSNLPVFTPRVNALAPPTKPISEELASKIRAYGFPPLPRSRAAMSKKGKKIEKTEKAEKAEKPDKGEKS